MATLTIEIESREIPDLLKEVLKKLNLSYKLKEEKPYDPEFVAMIHESEQQIKEGKTVKYDPSSTSLWDLATSR